MSRPSPPMTEVLRRLAAKDADLAEQIIELFDEHRLAATIKQIRPRIKTTTAYRHSERIRVLMGLTK